MKQVAARKRQGCLTALLSMISPPRPVTQIYGSSAVDPGPAEAAAQPESVGTAASDVLPYKLQFSILTPPEATFYAALKRITQDRIEILCKVRLGDVFFTPNYYQNVAHANRINQKHIDFLICESSTMKPLLGIELDDATHRRSKRRDRDEFVDDVFEATGLPLLHIQAKQAYDSQELIAQISEVMAKVPTKR